MVLNGRGVGNGEFLTQAKAIIIDDYIEILTLIETKVLSSKAYDIFKAQNFD